MTCWILLALILFFCANHCAAQRCKLLDECGAAQGYGECAPDGTSCLCYSGFKGDSCSIGPDRIGEDLVVPGFVEQGGTAYFQVDALDYSIGDEVVVVTTGPGTVEVFASIGLVPQPDEKGTFRFQYQALEQSGQMVISLTSLASKDDTLDELSLFIAVKANDVPSGNGVEFEIFHWTSTSSARIIPGIDDWATYTIIALLFVVVCGLCALGCVCWIAAEGELDEDEQGSALQLAEKKRLAEEKRLAEDPYYLGEQHQGYGSNGNSFGGNGGNMNMAAAGGPDTRNRFQTAFDAPDPQRNRFETAFEDPYAGGANGGGTFNNSGNGGGYAHNGGGYAHGGGGGGGGYAHGGGSGGNGSLNSFQNLQPTW